MGKREHIYEMCIRDRYKETLDKGIVFIFQINDLSGIKMCDEDIVCLLYTSRACMKEREFYVAFLEKLEKL